MKKKQKGEAITKSYQKESKKTTQQTVFTYIVRMEPQPTFLTRKCTIKNKKKKM